jgi:PTS system mannose-specific IIB component
VGIVFYRLDDRLIHGQVVEAWFPQIRPDLVVVANNEAAANEFQRGLMEMVVPFGVRSEIITIEQAVRRSSDAAYSASCMMMLFRSPRDVLRALDLGLAIDRLNLGGLHSDGDTEFLGRGVNASAEDLEYLKKIIGFGVKVEIRSVPSELVVDLQGLL